MGKKTWNGVGIGILAAVGIMMYGKLKEIKGYISGVSTIIDAQNKNNKKDKKDESE